MSIISRYGIWLQITQFLVILMINLVVPRYFGMPAFGESVQITAIAFLFQGLLEACLQPLLIQWAELRNWQRCRALFRDAMVWFLIGAICGIILIFRNPNFGQNLWIYLLEFLLFYGCLFVFTFFSAWCFQMQAYGVLILALSIQFFVLLLSFYAFRTEGTIGILAAQVLSYGLSILPLSVAFKKRGRIQYQTILRAQVIPWKQNLATYGHVSSVRLSLLTLNTLPIIIGGFYLAVPQVATIKLGLALIGSGIFLLPFQARIVQIQALQHVDLKSYAVKVISAAFAFSLGISCLAYMVYPTIFSHLLKVNNIIINKALFVGMPFYSVIPLIAALIISRSAFGVLLGCFVVLLALFIGGTLFGGVAVGFMSGAVGYCLVGIGWIFRKRLPK